jgi:hypothetical protein
MKDEALKLALEALEIQAYNSGDEKYTQAITVIKQALAAPTVQEPVAWMDKYGELYKEIERVLPTDKPLYTTPPAAPVQEPVAFFDWYDNAHWGNEDFKEGCHRSWNAAIKQALAAQPAPAAFEVSIVEWVGNKLMATPKNAQEFTCSTGLCHYKAQRQWVGLSGKEIQTIWRHSEHMDVNEVCQAIEAKLKEKNT